MAMDRRTFVALGATSALGLLTSGCVSGGSLAQAISAPAPRRDPNSLRPDELEPVPAGVQAEFDALVLWLGVSGWAGYLHRLVGVDLSPGSLAVEAELLRRLQVPRTHGFRDFEGIRLIEPGSPAQSLLYHALASPKVKPTDEAGAGLPPTAYPSTEQLDALENYIYARLKLPAYTPAPVDLVLGVFAYEYRPADKTPHGRHADLVFSRTGVARVGNQPLNYAGEQRCYVNRPTAAASPQDVAVTPARYGLFLARAVRSADALSLIKVDSQDRERTFLLPVRKVFSGDALLGGGLVVFAESHRNEKLYRLVERDDIELPPDTFDIHRPPFVRRSSTLAAAGFVPDPRYHDSSLVSLARRGSSVLLAPTPCEIVRPAVQVVGGRAERVRIRVPPGKTTNRRYTSFRITEAPVPRVLGFIADVFTSGYRQPSGIGAPYSAPAFVNVRHEVREEDGEPVGHLDAGEASYEKIRAGGYWAGMFEDGICDGCVHARLLPPPSGPPVSDRQEGLLLGQHILPAFSIVTAPDLLPLVDATDLEEFDDHFLEGGTPVLSGLRVRANPNVRYPESDESAFPDHDDGVHPERDTVTAVLTDRVEQGPWFLGGARDYQSSNTLPDSASSVFYPGWDVTYSGPRGDVHLSTVGLGLPFPEDIKLCAAANGMWPGTSPDSARTFHGSLEPVLPLHRRAPTAVPLLDSELGYHRESPAVRFHGLRESYGWDGEQGPFLDWAGVGDLRVNLTDIKASDYVANVLAGRMDFDLLRGLTTGEIIARMDALRLCIRRLPGGGVPKSTGLWLVSAERVDNWNAGAPGTGIPADLFGETTWATVSRISHSGPGYLYVFADTRSGPVPVPFEPARMTQPCASIYVCQVGGGRVAWVRVRPNAAAPPRESEWTVFGGMPYGPGSRG